MKIHQTKFEYITIAEDVYPFDDARKLLEQLESWWEHPSRRRFLSNTNYKLGDVNITNSLEHSLTHKLINGNFAFVMHKDQVVLYGGLQVDGTDSWMHRLTANPELFIRHVGASASILIPFQIKKAIEIGCKSYKITLNDDNYRFYQGWDNGKYTNSSIIKYPDGLQRLSEFEYVGKETINHTDQWIVKLDLEKEDILRFTDYE